MSLWAWGPCSSVQFEGGHPKSLECADVKFGFKWSSRDTEFPWNRKLRDVRDLGLGGLTLLHVALNRVPRSQDLCTQ